MIGSALGFIEAYDVVSCVSASGCCGLEVVGNSVDSMMVEVVELLQL